MCSHLSSQLKRAIYTSFFSPPQYHYHYHYHHLLRSPLSTQTHPKELPFIADYLISSFGFSLDRALKASANRNLKTIKSSARPEAVVKLLTDTGLSHSEIKSVVSLRPSLLGSNVDKILKPKVREMMEKGIPREVLVQLIRYNPSVLQLKDTLGRLLFWRDFVGNNDKALLKIISRNFFLFSVHIDKHILPRINLLKEYGLSNQDMVSLLEKRTCFCRNLDSIRQLLDLIEELGILRGSGMFLQGLDAIASLSIGKIKSNAEFFKNTYGWSQEEVCAAFRKYPVVLQLSEENENVRSKMNFLMSKAGFEAIKSPAWPETVVKFLIDTGLSHSQIKSAVSLRPALLGSNADKTLRPKVREMMEKGIPGKVLVQMIWYSPVVLQLKDTTAHLLFWRDFVGKNNKALMKIISKNPHLELDFSAFNT